MNVVRKSEITRNSESENYFILIVKRRKLIILYAPLMNPISVELQLVKLELQLVPSKTKVESYQKKKEKKRLVYLMITCNHLNALGNNYTIDFFVYVHKKLKLPENDRSPIRVQRAVYEYPQPNIQGKSTNRSS